MAVSAGDVQARATLDNVEFLKALQDMANAVAAQTSAIAKQIGNLSSTFDSITGAITKIGALAGVTDFAKSFVDAAAAVGKLEAAFKNIAGPTEETAQAFEQIRDLQFNSIYSFEDTLGPTAKKMLEVGISATQAAETMQALTDAAAGMKESPQWIEEVGASIDKLSSHLVATQKDMRSLQAEGIDAWGALADYMGTSIADAQAKVKAGMVSSQTVIKAVTEQMESDWAGMAEKSTQTWKGAMDQVGKQAGEAQVAIGQTIIAVLQQLVPVMQAVAQGLADLTKWWQGLGEGTKEAIVIFTAVAGGIVAVTVAVSTLLPLLGSLGTVFMALVTGSNPAGWIALVVGALAVLAKWIYDNWEPLKASVLAMWDGIKEQWGPAIEFITNLFSPILTVWKAEWDLLTGILSTAFEMIKTVINGTGDYISSFWNWLKGIFGKIPGLSEIISQTQQAWNDGQKVLDQQKQAAAAQKQADDAAAAASAAKRQAAKQEAADEVAAEAAAKAAAQAEKERAAQAKKDAEDWQKYNEDIAKGYEKLLALSPELAAQFSEAFGGISDDADKVAKEFGKAWANMSDSMKQAVRDAVETQEAFKTLGVTSQASLEDAAAKADQAYIQIAGSATASAKDVESAAAAQQAAHQKVVDFLNSDAITAVHAFGDKTQEELQKSQDDWFKYASQVTAYFGDGSKQALDAQVKALEEYRKNVQAQGKDLSDSELEFLAELKQRAADAVDPVTKLANAYKALGVTTIKTQLDQVTALAKAFDTVKASGTAAQADLYAAQKKLTDATQQHVDYLNQDWKDAYSRGEITATQMYQHEVENARAYLQQLTLTGDGGAASMAEIDAATKVYDQTLKNLQKSTLLDTQTAFHDLGVKSSAELQTMADKAETEYQRIVDTAGADSEQARMAWVNKTKAAYDQILLDGGTLTEGQKAELDKAQLQLDQHLKDTQSAWKTAYDGINTAVGTAFDDMAKALVTGDQSFGQIMQKMWQDIATTALNVFIAPIKKAVADFIANELADLIGGKGLGGVLDGLKSIGSAVGGLFKGAGGAASSAAEEGAGVAEQAAGGAEEAAGGAESAVSAGMSGAMGIVGAVGSIGTMVSSIIGNFQQAKMETTMNAVEHNTRYSALYLGDRSDGGILGQMFRVASDLEFGPIVKILEQHRDNFWNWSGIILPIEQAVQANLIDISSHTFTQIQVLEQIRDVLGQIESQTAAAASTSTTINVSPQGLTTAEAAKALGDQIARNLTRQLTPVS